MGNVNLGDFELIEPESFSLLEPGWYGAEVTNSEKRESATGNDYLNIEFTLDSGRKCWDIFSIWHEKPDVKEIARRKLSDLVRACRKGEIKNSQELHGDTLQLQIKIEKSKETDVSGEPISRNRVQAYRIGGDTRPPGAAAANTSATPWAQSAA